MSDNRTPQSRLHIVNQTKMKCIELELTNDIATKILFSMLDNYHKDGTTYNKELKLQQRHQIPRKYVVNLYNDKNIRDEVFIRALEPSELVKPIPAIPKDETESESESDDEVPMLTPS